MRTDHLDPRPSRYLFPFLRSHRRSSIRRRPASQARPLDAMSARYDDLQWQPIVPELGADWPAGVDSARRSQDARDPAADSHAEADARPDALAQRERDPYGDQGHDGLRARGPAARARARRLQLPSRPHAHQAWSSDDALVFITVESGWDVNWVNGPPTRSDLGQRPPSQLTWPPTLPRRDGAT